MTAQMGQKRKHLGARGFAWGLSGICCSQGIILVGSLDVPAVAFVGAVIAGSLLSDLFAGD